MSFKYTLLLVEESVVSNSKVTNNAVPQQTTPRLLFNETTVSEIRGLSDPIATPSALVAKVAAALPQSKGCIIREELDMEVENRWKRFVKHLQTRLTQVDMGDACELGRQCVCETFPASPPHTPSIPASSLSHTWDARALERELEAEGVSTQYRKVWEGASLSTFAHETELT
ncbi:hypothetical protein BGY98DRAFT_940439 [Russula aff. rugulosa BPL654]|nr:hypothetical protein BGY98DRAFT_940439 [Russula aff. rugulosa BPL654]